MLTEKRCSLKVVCISSVVMSTISNTLMRQIISYNFYVRVNVDNKIGCNCSTVNIDYINQLPIMWS